MAQPKTVVFDLETIADPAAEEFLPPIVPAGNLKDPVKIKADIQEKRQKQLEMMGLDPMTNLICCASFLDLATQEKTSFLLNNEFTEADLLKKIWVQLHGYGRFVTFNGMAFDVPVLTIHSMVRRVPMSVKISQARYRIDNHVDIRMLFTNWDARARGNQGMWCQRMGLPGKPDAIDGSAVQHYWDCGMKDEIRKYCEDDVTQLAELYRLAQGYFL